MIAVVISDIHSRKSKLLEALRQAEVVNSEGVRQPGYQLIQVGDAVSAGYGMDEAEFYRWWTSFLEDQDVEIVGNHEAPILWNYDDRFKFYGYRPGDMGTSGCDPELKIEVLTRRDKYVAAYAVNDWLITHAGVRKGFQLDTAQATADDLNRMWDQHMISLLPHHWMGCPICCNQNGIMWVRDIEKSCIDPTPIKQMFGHTPDGPTLSKGGTVWNIDTPRIGEFTNRKEAESFGGVCVMKWNDTKSDWDPFYVR